MSAESHALDGRSSCMTPFRFLHQATNIVIDCCNRRARRRMVTVELRLVLCAILAIATLSLADEPVCAWTASPGAPTAESALAAAVAQQPANGRVVVTMALEGIRIPAVSVVLRSVDRNVVVAQTTSDAIGQVTFPDIPPGRYLVHTSRDGFARDRFAALQPAERGD